MKKRTVIFKNHKTIIIAAAVIAVLLAGAWAFGGNYNKGGGDAVNAAPEAPAQTSETSVPHVGESASPPTETATAADAPDAGRNSASASEPSAPSTQPERPVSPDQAPSSTPSAATMMETSPDAGKDKYLTDPVPSGKPLPVEPQDAAKGDGSFTVEFTVRCDTILSNMDLLSKEKWELVPDDGVVFPMTTVTAYEGESVFNVLQREMKRAKIHMEFMNTPIYNSAYIEAINNLYEFDAGELSGWMYAVNGWYPNYGCSRYQLKAGDVIEWRYTCDLGRDLGQTFIGSQRDE